MATAVVGVLQAAAGPPATTAGWVLVGAGALTGLAALLAGVTIKGGRAHRWVGRIGVAASAVAALGAAARPGVAASVGVGIESAAFGPAAPAVLAALGVYLLASGTRALGRKRPGRDFATPLDWTIAALGLPVAAWLAVRGARSFFLRPVGRAPALLAFGALGLGLVLLDLWDYYHPVATGTGWVYRHVGRSLAGAAATATAAAAVAPLPDGTPAYLPWLGPSLVGTVLAVLAFWYLGRQFGRGAAPAEVFAGLRWGGDAGPGE